MAVQCPKTLQEDKKNGKRGRREGKDARARHGLSSITPSPPMRYPSRLICSIAIPQWRWPIRWMSPWRRARGKKRTPPSKRGNVWQRCSRTSPVGHRFFWVSYPPCSPSYCRWKDARRHARALRKGRPSLTPFRLARHPCPLPFPYPPPVVRGRLPRHPVV